jgi:hypothetical protein
MTPNPALTTFIAKVRSICGREAARGALFGWLIAVMSNPAFRFVLVADVTPVRRAWRSTDTLRQKLRYPVDQEA